jgi:hypothetical protein
MNRRPSFRQMPRTLAFRRKLSFSAMDCSECTSKSFIHEESASKASSTVHPRPFRVHTRSDHALFENFVEACDTSSHASEASRTDSDLAPVASDCISIDPRGLKRVSATGAEGRTAFTQRNEKSACPQTPQTRSKLNKRAIDLSVKANDDHLVDDFVQFQTHVHNFKDRQIAASGSRRLISFSSVSRVPSFAQKKCGRTHCENFQSKRFGFQSRAKRHLISRSFGLY